MEIETYGEPIYIPVKGGCCYAPTFGMFVYVTRVAKSGEWADIRVSDNNGAEWRKRQPLARGGVFPFVVHPVSAA